MTKKKKLSVEAAAKEWIELKSVEQAIEVRRAELKAVLDPALESAPEKRLLLHGWEFLKSTFSRESFSLSKAKEKIPAKTLAPYVTTSEVTQIRTTWKGGIEKENA